jgi:DNA-binding response OmpR family regulator
MLVELHHGTIHATNKVDTQGCCFTVSIPLGKEHLTTEEISGKQNTASITFDANLRFYESDTHGVTYKYSPKNRILIVDDDEDLQDYLQEQLIHKYKVVSVNNGHEAMQALLRQRIDLILLDIMMPDIDGFSLLKQIRSNAVVSHVPVVLLTSQVEAELRMRGWDIGADGFLNKPFILKELILICDNLISGRARLKGAFEGMKELGSIVVPLNVESNDERFTNRLMEIINKNLDNSKFSVEELASEIGLSRAQLFRKVKEKTGVSTSEFIRNIRLDQAAKLVREKKANISQIAYATGFGNPIAFNTAFKKLYGCTPTQYAQRIAETEE